MKKLVLMVVLGGIIISAKAQNANPDVQTLMIPATLPLNQTGVFQITTCNTGSGASDQIVANSLRIVASVNTNAQIIGLDQSTSDSRWTVEAGSLGSGPANSIRLVNTGGTMTSSGVESDCATINLIVKAVALDGHVQDLMGATISYINAHNPLIGGLFNSSQGNTQTVDDLSQTGLIVVASLPVHLLSFTAQKVGTHSLLNWSYDKAVNFSHFELERSSNGVSFSNLNNKQYKIADNTVGAAQFNETDMQPINGDNYYRLKMVDLDGKFSYSEARKLNFVVAGVINVFPNPATDRIKVTGASNGSSIMLFDPEGKLLKTIKASGNLIDEMSLSGYSGGQYIIKVTGGTITANLRILKIQ